MKAVTGVAAAGVLTSDNTNVTAGKKVTIGSKIYTFVAALTKEIAASGILTSDNTNPAVGDTVTIGNRVYTFDDAFSAVKAAGVLTSDNTNPTQNDSVVIGTKTYVFKTTVPAVKASGNITSDNTNPTAGDSVIIGSVTYEFVAALTGGTGLPYEVLIGSDGDDTLANLKAAINGAAGEDTIFGHGTVAHASVDAGTIAAHVLPIAAKTAGVAGNSIVFLESADHITVDGSGTLASGEDAEAANTIQIGADADTTLANLKAAINGAAGEGTLFGTGTVAHTLVDAGAIDTGAHTLALAAKTAGVAGNAIVFTEDSTHLTVTGAGTLINGDDAEGANQIMIGVDADTTLGNLKAAINGEAGSGTKFSVGTVVHADVTCGTISAHAITIAAKVTGVDGNAIAKAEDSSHLDWDGSGAYLTGGVGGVARGTLTSDNTNVAAGATVTIGDIVYTFRASLTTNPSHVPYEVKIGSDADGSMNNLIAAINGSAGRGVTYSSGTETHPDVTAGVLAAHAFIVYAKERGSDGNLIAKAETSTHLDWDGTGAYLTGGVSEIPYEVLIGADADGSLANLRDAINGDDTVGVDYSTGTVAHPDVTCSDITSHAVTVTAVATGTAGNAIAKAEDDDHLDWDGSGGFLTGGVDAVAEALGVTALGEGGMMTRIDVTAPSLSGATYDIIIKDEDGVVLAEYDANLESVTSSFYCDPALPLNPSDTITLTPSVEPTSAAFVVKIR